MYDRPDVTFLAELRTFSPGEKGAALASLNLKERLQASAPRDIGEGQLRSLWAIFVLLFLPNCSASAQLRTPAGILHSHRLHGTLVPPETVIEYLHFSYQPMRYLV